jgi:hypothetical protein
MTLPRFAGALAISFLTLWSGCDSGLAPLNEPAGFRGVIRFKNWPPPDSVVELRLVAFETFPSDSASILPGLIAGQIVFYPPFGSSGFPTFLDSLEYAFTTKGTTLQVKKYDYVVIALRYGQNVLTDWKPVGVYTTTPNSFIPAPVRVLLHRITPDIDFQVDFHNTPPKPWR